MKDRRDLDGVIMCAKARKCMALLGGWFRAVVGLAGKIALILKWSTEQGPSVCTTVLCLLGVIYRLHLEFKLTVIWY